MEFTAKLYFHDILYKDELMEYPGNEAVLIVRFSDSLPEDGHWTLIICLDTLTQKDNSIIAIVRFPSQENIPKNLLFSGSEFEMNYATRKVGVGKLI